MSCTLPWSNARIEALTRLWRDGLSASAIACALGGTTRNAVIGKVHRLGLSGRRPPTKPGRRRARAAKPEPRIPRARLTPVSPRPAVEAPPQAGSADLLSVGRHACRWPIGDPKVPGFSLCGRRVERGAYCAAHAALAYRPAARDHLLRLAGLA